MNASGNDFSTLVQHLINTSDQFFSLKYYFSFSINNIVTIDNGQNKYREHVFYEHNSNGRGEGVDE